MTQLAGEGVTVLSCRLRENEWRTLASGEVGFIGETADELELVWRSFVSPELAVTLCPLKTLRRDRRASDNTEFELRIATQNGERFLLLDAYSSTVWRVSNQLVPEPVVSLDRPRDLQTSLMFCDFRSSHDGSVVGCFTESSMAVFRNFEIEFVEEYDELLWRPLAVENDEILLEHYQYGTRRVRITQRYV